MSDLIRETTIREEGYYWVREHGQQPVVALWTGGDWLFAGSVQGVRNEDVVVMGRRLRLSDIGHEAGPRG